MLTRTLALLAMALAVACGAVTSTISARAQAAQPLFAVGIDGGFTGASMRATVYVDGSVVIVRQGMGRPLHREQRTVPLSRTSVAAAIRLAKEQKIFAIPRTLQDKPYGADIPVISLQIFTAVGSKSVHAMGGENAHLPGTAKLFPVWGLFYALAGYPVQLA